MQRQDLGLAVGGVVVTTVVALVLTSTPDGLVADASGPVLPAAPRRVQAGPGTSAAVSPAAPRHTGEVAVLHPLAVSALVQRQPAPRPAQAVEAVDGAAGLAKPPTETSADGVRGSTELVEPAGSVLGARPAGVRPRGRAGAESVTSTHPARPASATSRPTSTPQRPTPHTSAGMPT